jgi:hypothetical protein
MEFTVFTHVKQTPVGALGHLLDRFLDGQQLVLDVRILGWFLIKKAENLNSFIIPALHHQPTRRFGQVEDGGENHDGKENLEGQREPPCHLTLPDEGKA